MDSSVEPTEPLGEVEETEGVIIFVRTKTATVELAEKLEARGYVFASQTDTEVIAHLVDHPARVGAVADEVAEEGVAVHALRGGVGHHRAHRFAVGVQVGEQGKAHAGSVAGGLPPMLTPGRGRFDWRMVAGAPRPRAHFTGGSRTGCGTC